VYLLFPAIYLLYFSFQRVMIARNLLVLFPFVALLIAEGIVFLYRRYEFWRRTALSFVVAGILLFNLGWLIFAAESIPAYDETAALRQLTRYIERHPHRDFYVQASAAERFAEAGLALPANATSGAAVKGDYLVLFGTDVWRANDPFAITAMFGPFDINFGMYPRWPGPSRYVIISNAQAIGIYRTWDFE
jgi:hypothetical protein